MPIRIQRKRTKGWKMPENAVYVGRPSVFGNRWKVGVHSNHYGRPIQTAEEAVERYANMLMLKENSHMVGYYTERLRGKDLACWCPLDQPCHADVLLKLVNS